MDTAILKELTDNLHCNLQLLGPKNEARHKQWHLLIGEKNAGKTSLLNQSDLQLNQTIDNNNNELNSWQNGKAIFFELPEQLQSKEALSLFVKIIKKYRKKNAFDSINVCLNTYHSLSFPPRDFIEQLKKIQQCIFFLTTSSSITIKLNIVFTQMDKIAGFCQTFTGSQLHLWGYNFTPYPNKASLIKQNNNKFKLLLQKLHQQLIDKLHNNDQQLARFLIREFPLQMESIGNMVRACVSHLSNCNVTHTEAIFFTSAKQANYAEDRLSNVISNTFSLVAKNKVPQSSRENSFFTQGFIDTVSNQTPLDKKQRNVVAITATTSVCFVVVAFFVVRLFLSTELVEKAKREIALSNSTNTSSLKELIPTLNHLSKAKKSVDQLQGTLPLKNIALFKKHINQQLSDSLHKKLVPQIASFIEHKLETDKDPVHLFNALKAYIMLTTKEKLDARFLTIWLSLQWRGNKTEKQITLLNHYLVQALSTNHNKTEENDTLINNTRNYLNALPQHYLTYAIAKRSMLLSKKQLHNKYFLLAYKNIPNLYSKKYFNDVYFNKLPDIATKIAKDNFVLKSHYDRTLGKTLQKVYVKDYINFWHKFSKYTLPLSFSTYKEGAQLFDHLSKKQNELENITNLIQKNTAFENNNSDTKTFNTLIATHFTTFNLIDKSQLQKIHPVFQKLSDYFYTLNTSNNYEKSAFEVAKIRFTQHTNDPISQLNAIATTLPEPLNQWIMRFSNNAWVLILSDAQQHINKQWKQNVYEAYTKNIKHRFPFAETTKQEVKINDFNQFFGYQGKLQQFISYYIKPFLDIHQPEWKTKSVDGLRLPISDEVVQELIRVNIIREMFFPNQSNQANIQFSLHAIALEPIIGRLSLNIAGKSIVETQDNKQSAEFFWAGSKRQSGSVLKIENINGEAFKHNEYGSWGWLRMIMKGTLTPVDNDTKNYELLLSLQGNSGKFLLSTNRPINPFIPGILQSFYLPNEIS